MKDLSRLKKRELIQECRKLHDKLLNYRSQVIEMLNDARMKQLDEAAKLENDNSDLAYRKQQMRYYADGALKEVRDNIISIQVED